MTTEKFATIDGNEAAARIAYQLNEVIALFPITPASPTAAPWSRPNQPLDRRALLLLTRFPA